MTHFIQTLISGLSLGSIYALIALGYTMVYGIGKMLNFAHGDIIMAGGYTVMLFFSAIGSFYTAIAVCIVLAILACTLAGVAVERFAYRPLRGASPLAVLITAIGVSYLMQSAAQMIFGVEPVNIPLNRLGSVTIGKLTVDGAAIVTLLSAVVIMAGLTLFVNKTKTGKAMLAVSADKSAATLCGIGVNRIIMLTFAIGSALAGVASFFIVLKTPTAVTPTMGSMPGIKAFTAAVIGGIGSIPGAMLGGVLLGVTESFLNAVPSVAPYTDAIEFALLIAILLVKPAGILGKTRKEKV